MNASASTDVEEIKSRRSLRENQGSNLAEWENSTQQLQWEEIRWGFSTRAVSIMEVRPHPFCTFKTWPSWKRHPLYDVVGSKKKGHFGRPSTQIQARLALPGREGTPHSLHGPSRPPRKGRANPKPPDANKTRTYGAAPPEGQLRQSSRGAPTKALPSLSPLPPSPPPSSGSVPSPPFLNSNWWTGACAVKKNLILGKLAIRQASVQPQPRVSPIPGLRPGPLGHWVVV